MFYKMKSCCDIRWCYSPDLLWRKENKTQTWIKRFSCFLPTNNKSNVIKNLFFFFLLHYNKMWININQWILNCLSNNVSVFCDDFQKSDLKWRKLPLHQLYFESVTLSLPPQPSALSGTMRCVWVCVGTRTGARGTSLMSTTTRHADFTWRRKQQRLIGTQRHSG